MAHDNTEKMSITKPGTITITTDGIHCKGFEADNATCREVAIMAAAWGIGELQREMLKDIEEPGGGNTSVD